MTATAGAIPEEAAGSGALFEAPAVLRMVWADPRHMAEHIAVWSLGRFGPHAAAAAGRLRRENPAAGREELGRLVIERQARLAAAEGSFVGGPFILLVPVAFCASLLAQAQMVFELAAVAGHEPNDQMRAADLLVLLGAYKSLDEANAGLATMTRDPARHAGRRLPAGTRWDTVRRMAYLLEVLGSTEERRGRLRVALGWAGIGALILAGFILPLVWVPYLGYVSRRSTIRLGERARGYYAARQTGEAGVRVRSHQRVRVGGAAALARGALFAVGPVLIGIMALTSGLSFGGGRWATAGIVLLAASALMTMGWFGYRWVQRRLGGQLGRLIRAIRDLDESAAQDAVIRLSRSRRLFAPAALAVGAVMMLFDGLKLLFANWRLTLIQVLPAMWIWAAMFDLKIHVLRGKSFHLVHGWVALLALLGVTVVTAASFYLNAVFAYAIARPGQPQIRAGARQARAHVWVILGWGAAVGICLGVSGIIFTRWGKWWFLTSMSIVVGVMMVCYVAVPARLIGIRTTHSRRDKLTASVVAGALGAVVSTPGYALGRIGILLLQSRALFIVGVIMLAMGATLQAGTTTAVKTIQMSAKLISGRRQDAGGRALSRGTPRSAGR